MFGFVKRLMNSKVYYCHIDSEPVSFAYNVEGLFFNYRRQITVIERSGNDLIDYQVLIELDSSNFDFSHANNDGSDIRFYDGENILPHWIEKWDSVNQEAKIWVKVPSIPASSSTSFYMYYGNPNITSASNGEDTFEFFDDFEEVTLNADKWDIVGSGNISLSNSLCTITSDGNHTGIIGKTSFGQKYAIRIYSRTTTYENGHSWGGWADTENAAQNSARIIYGSGGCAYHTFKNGTGNYLYSITLDTEFHTFEIIRISENKLTFKHDNDLDIYTETDSSKIPSVAMYPHCTNWLDDMTTEIDWILVRKYTDPEPSVSIGSEETP